jgi:hypothetical protein
LEATDQLDRLIASRAGSKANLEEELWKSAERLYREEREEARGHAWRTYWTRLAANHREIARGLEERARRLGGPL